MKKAFLALALVAFTVMSLASCKSKEKCEAYSYNTAPKAHTRF
jgi:hypothetical protein